MKDGLAGHGIPKLSNSDNRPQYASTEFKMFVAEYSFMHVTSSSKYPQANGAAQRAVQMVKLVVKKGLILMQSF